jgi:hypothetical protein
MEPEANRDSLPPEPKWSSPAASVFAWAQHNLPPTNQQQRLAQPPQPAAEALALQQRLQKERDEARAELAAMHELLEDLPQIFERKFQQRLKPILEDNVQLRSQLQQLQQLQGSPEPGRQPQLPPIPRKPRIRKALRHAFGLPSSDPQSDQQAA